MNNKDDKVDVSQHPIFPSFAHVFLEYLLGFPPKRELEFTIELKPGMEPISKAPYHMTTPELRELQM